MEGQLARRSDVQVLERRINKVEAGHRRLSDRVDDMRGLLEQNTAMTAEVRDVMASLKGFAAVLGWVGSGLYYFGKFVVLPAAAIGGIGYAAFHHWKFPEWWLQMVKFFME